MALILKVQCPFSMGDYRPTSLLWCLYKILAKVLKARLSAVMDFLVSQVQSTFLKGRYLADGVLVVNEVVELVKKSHSNCLIFKVDFEKTYDLVSW